MGEKDLRVSADQLSQDVEAEMRRALQREAPVDEDHAFYTKPGSTFPYSYMHARPEDCKPRPECILTEKVINECFVAECPIVLRVEVPGVYSIEDCEVEAVTLIEKDVPEDGVVEFTVRFFVKTEVNTDTVVKRKVDFTKRIALQGADKHAFRQMVQRLRIFRFAQCLGCRIVDDNSIECEIGLFALVKLTTKAQLLVEAEFCPMPAECVEISGISCPEFLERAERGDFLPPVPEQFFPER